MSERFDQLSARHRELRARSEAQRRELGDIARRLEQRLSGVDRSMSAVRKFVRHPGVLAGAVGVLAFIGPRRLLNVASRSAGWLNAIRSLAPLARTPRNPQVQKKE